MQTFPFLKLLRNYAVLFQVVNSILNERIPFLIKTVLRHQYLRQNQLIRLQLHFRLRLWTQLYCCNLTSLLQAHSYLFFWIAYWRGMLLHYLHQCFLSPLIYPYDYHLISSFFPLMLLWIYFGMEFQVAKFSEI